MAYREAIGHYETLYLGEYLCILFTIYIHCK